jgi:probable HAF family extracellular repeat protein
MSTHKCHLAMLTLAAGALLVTPPSGAWAASTATLRYRVIDLGTLGGPNSAETVEFPYVNDAGLVVGFADTATPDPDNGEGFVFHAFGWHGGPMRDLGALPGGTNSFAIWSNSAGAVVGLSETGRTDPLLGAPESHGALWTDGRVVDLGTLGGHQSLAGYVNERGQVVGVAADAQPDDLSLFGWGTRTRAFLWEKGTMRDLGTLGGPDAGAAAVNGNGQVAGASYTTSTPNADTGIPTLHPFLWEKGRMTDLGTLGGTVGFANALNARGQVVGQSNLPGNETAHPFRWSDGTLEDLGTLGGSFGTATWMNDAGDVVGGATTTNDRAFHAFFWDDGRMTDLGTVGGDTCSVAHFMNAAGLVVGTSGDCDGQFQKHGFVTIRGGGMVDLNAFLPAGSELTIIDGETVNNNGEIAASGMLPNGDFHAVVLVPCTRGDDPGCRTAKSGDISTAAAATASPTRPASHPWTPMGIGATVSTFHRLLAASPHAASPLTRGRR